MFTRKNVTIACVVAFVVLIVLERLLAHPHHETFWHTMPGFDVLYGFVGCVAIVYISKWLGKMFLQRGEDYYDS